MFPFGRLCFVMERSPFRIVRAYPNDGRFPLKKVKYRVFLKNNRRNVCTVRNIFVSLQQKSSI